MDTFPFSRPLTYDYFSRPTPNRLITIYQGYLPGLRALYGPLHGGSQVRTDRGGQTSGTQGVGTGTGRQESVGKRDGTERISIGIAGAAGMVAQERKNISISRVCVSVRGVLQGGGWGGSQEAVRPMRFGTYDMRNSQNGGMESALR